MNADSTNPDVFGSYIHEDVLYCDTSDVQGGLSESEIYVCYQPFISFLKVPGIIASNQYAGQISKVLCVAGRGFYRIKALVESPNISSDYRGSGTVSDNSEFSAFLLGNRAELVGLSRKMRERPFTLIVRDNNGKKFLIGTLESPAYLKDFKIESGKKFDDDCGAEISFKSNTLFYEFTGNIPVIDPNAGDFSSEFDVDFD